jgi:hypothetical protein
MVLCTLAFALVFPALGAGYTTDLAGEDCSGQSCSELGRTQQLILRGTEYDDCTDQEVLALHGAIGVLYDEAINNYGNFRECMREAPLVEDRCWDPVDIAETIRQDKVVKIQCAQLDALNANATAPVSISGELMKVDTDFIANNTHRSIASVIAHELTHNRGFEHQENDFGSQYYSNTVPEQIEACILWGSPNASGGFKVDARKAECSDVVRHTTGKRDPGEGFGLDLSWYCRDVYGSSASAVAATPAHTGWRCRKGATDYGISIQLASCCALHDGSCSWKANTQTVSMTLTLREGGGRCVPTGSSAARREG